MCLHEAAQELVIEAEVGDLDRDGDGELPAVCRAGVRKDVVRRSERDMDGGLAAGNLAGGDGGRRQHGDTECRKPQARDHRTVLLERHDRRRTS